MTQFIFSNDFNTTLAAPFSSTATVMTVSSTVNLPALGVGEQFPVTLNDATSKLNYEIVYVTSIAGNNLTVIRGQEGTGILSWAAGAFVYCAFTTATTAASSGNPNNTFLGAPATASNEFITLSQAQADFAALAGLSTQAFAVANAVNPNEAVAMNQSFAGATANDVTSARAFGTVYTNTFGRAIGVGVVITLGTATGTSSLFVNGHEYVAAQSGNAYAAYGVSGLVPPGGTYYVTSLAGATLSGWVEIR